MENLIIILLSVLSLITLVASLILVRALFPARVERVQFILESQWKRSFWLGLINTVLITVVVFGLGSIANSAPILYIPAFGIYGALLIGLLFGLSAFNQHLGERLYPDLHPVKRDIRSGAVFLLASLLPFVGWFLIFPYIISLAVGAAVITAFQRRSAPEPPEDGEN